MNHMKTADLVDAHDAELRFCQMQWKKLGKKPSFHGPIETVRCFEDNVILRSVLETPGEGRVLVVDGAGSLRTALVGDMIALIGQKSGWAGIVINGAIRDADDIDQMDFSVLAQGTSPKKSSKLGTGVKGVTVSFGNVDFVPGHYLYADSDGVLVSEKNLIG
ncbi:ribonuclease E activity regulator RraA [Mesorhizobium sp. SB112]|uniref:ribonuclease E activity regulator RraA n=1 Tax=Mesorhizobium sp. SB112 TaxID=3151853 RepID=UPI0032639D5E